MKKLPFLSILVILLFSHLSFTQEVELEEIQPEPTTTEAKPNKDDLVDLNKKANIIESDESMSQGIQNAIIVETSSNDEKLVEGVWKKFMKDYGGKTKKSKGGKNEFTTTGAEIVGINGVNSLTVYSSAGTGTSGNIEMRLWFDMGEEYLESNRTSQYAEAERMLQKFAHEVKIENTKQELKGAEKTLKGYKGELKSLINKNEGYHRDIANYEKKIEEAKENIITNDQQQVDTNQKIELQMQLVDEIDRRLRALRKQ